MKKRRKTKNKFYIMFGLIIVYTLFMSVGFALFFDELNIAGTSSILKSCDEVMETNVSILDTVNNRHVLGPVPDRMAFHSETLNNNELTITYKLSGRGGGDMVSTLQFELNNIYTEAMYDGQITAEVSSVNEHLYNINPSLSTVYVDGGNPVMIDVTYGHRAHNLSQEEWAKITINYTVDGCTKYFYFWLVFIP